MLEQEGYEIEAVERFDGRCRPLFNAKVARTRDKARAGRAFPPEQLIVKLRLDFTAAGRMPLCRTADAGHAVRSSANGLQGVTAAEIARIRRCDA